MHHDLQAKLTDMAGRTAALEAWQPELLAADDPATWSRIEALLASGAVQRVHDTLEAQLRELMDTRDPTEEHLPAEELGRRVADHLGGTDPSRYGTWVFYPWSGRLVHVLPEDEFVEMRHSRNRNKITAEEQARLAALRIGVVGLSVGQASVITLAMEGVGGEYRLADFDHLSLTNTNRLRAGVHDLGVHKAHLTARTLHEMDPYVRVQLYPQGLTDANMDEFLTGHGGLDVLVEEADDLYMKVRLRERAKAAGIPVIMETSDRGLVDVERFDKEPDRPILHGLVGDLDAESLRGLDTYDKVPIVLGILDQRTISPRLAASMVDIRSTLKTWPQLASAVSLGAAIVTDSVRRIALGQFNESGRFYVDLDELVRDGGARAYPTRQEWTPAISPESMRIEAPAVQRVAARLGEDELRTLVHYGVMAPSGGNVQPWRFESRRGGLRLFHDVDKSRSFLDFEHTASYMTFGAVVENIDLVAARMGLATHVRLFPQPDDRLVICDLEFEPSAGAEVDEDLFAAIAQRTTNRKLGRRVPMADGDADALRRAARVRGGKLHLLQGEDELERLGRVLGQSDRVRFLHRTMHQEMMGEIRWSREEVERTRDGLDVATLELTPTDLAGMRLSSSWKVMDLVGRFGGGRSLEKPTKKAIAAASAAGLVTVPGQRPEDYFQGGRALQRVWLEATRLGYAFQPMTAILYVYARLEAGGEGLDPTQQAEVAALRQQHNEIFPEAVGQGEIMMFRVSRTEPPTARSLRRRVDEVLTFV